MKCSSHKNDLGKGKIYRVSGYIYRIAYCPQCRHRKVVKGYKEVKNATKR